jgi:hypothetical protein
VVVAVAAAGAVTALFEADMGRGILLSSTTVALMPPALYLVLAFILLRGVPLGRRLGWAVAACGVNALLAVLSGLTLSLTHPMSFEGAMRRALWAFAPGPLIHLVAAPLALLGWRSRIAPLRVNVRSESLLGSGVPALPLESSTPNWDAVMRMSVPWRRGGAKPSRPVFDRPMREPEVDPEPTPVMRAAPAPVAVPVVPGEVAPAPLVAAPPAPRTPPPLAAAPALWTPPPPVAAAPALWTPPPPVATAPARRTPPPAAATSPAMAPTQTAGEALEPILDEMSAPAAIDEPVIRVPFDRIADQLPPDVFVLPPERLAESVREPHVIVIPCRLVLPQLGEGAVEVPWTLIDDQFPELALAMPKADVRRRFPGWVLSLPMDEVVRQIPADVFRVQAPAADLFDIGQFPAPFKPEPPAPEEAREPESATEPIVDFAPAPPAVAEPIALELEPAPIEPEPVREDEIPAVVFAFEEPAAAPTSMAAPVAPASAEPAVDPTPSPVAIAAPAVPTVVPVTPPPVVAPAPPAVGATDDECETLGRALALGLVPLGAFDWHARRVGGRPLVSFVPPALPREPIDALAASAAPLVECLVSWGIEQVTIRTTRLVCVLTPLGTRGCLAATVRRGGAVAMLEMLSTRAGRVTRDSPAVAPAIAFPAVATAPARTDNGHRAVGEAARVLAAFGPLAMSVAEAEGAAPSVYVFGGQDQAVLAGAARAVHATLVTGHDQEALGRLESVMLRRGRERAVLRPLRVHGGAPAVLAAAGEVALVGRAHRAVAQAAALLEAR